MSGVWVDSTVFDAKLLYLILVFWYLAVRTLKNRTIGFAYDYLYFAYLNVNTWCLEGGVIAASVAWKLTSVD